MGPNASIGGGQSISGREPGIRRVRNGVTLNAAWLSPRSRGQVRLRSSNPLASPHIEFNDWGEAEDVRRSIAGFRPDRLIMAQAAFRPLVWNEAHPGNRVTTDDDIIECVCRHAEADYHPVGTCRMGDADDSRLRFRGIDAQRICDSALMQSVVSSSTIAAATMIAKLAAALADIIRNDHVI